MPLGAHFLLPFALELFGGVAERDNSVHRAAFAVEHQRVIDLKPAKTPRIEVFHAQRGRPARLPRLHLSIQTQEQILVLGRHYACGDDAFWHIRHAHRRPQETLDRPLHDERAVGKIIRGNVPAAHPSSDAKRILAHTQALGGVHPRADVQHEARDDSALRIVPAPRHRPKQRARRRLLLDLDLEFVDPRFDMRTQLLAEVAPATRFLHVERIALVGAPASVA